MATTSNEDVTPNFLIRASNGLFLFSGATGGVRKLTDEDVAAVSDLLAERQELGAKLVELVADQGTLVAVSDLLAKRQELGAKLAELLKERGFELGPSIIWDGP